ncbi:hypothetical protein D8674_022043 [Pyrus ussuriensis x Pyrus communis]|uniref:Uncharacterized protein n=1 Tax=Pyrus ussuriensis x Pyrus communis TaxID=2448454 RepID=A0A5N5GIV3_9ROSA|nr:hypothetical protein D8674_022043 [Pyrus ussuriensis x Pyrus communis]
MEAPNQAFAPPPQQPPLDTSLEDTLELIAQSTLQFQQSTSSMIQEHSIALTKLEVQLGQIVQALNEQQPCGDGQDVNVEQSLESSCAYIHREVLEFEVPFLESLGDGLLPYQEENELKLDNESLLPIHHKKEDSKLDDEIVA